MCIRDRPGSRASRQSPLHDDTAGLCSTGEVQMMYSTIARDGSAEVEFKRSRFICQLRRVEDEYGARAVIVAARKEHWDARHHCSAFVLGPSAGVRRSNCLLYTSDAADDLTRVD